MVITLPCHKNCIVGNALGEKQAKNFPILKMETRTFSSFNNVLNFNPSNISLNYYHHHYLLKSLLSLSNLSPIKF